MAGVAMDRMAVATATVARSVATFFMTCVFRSVSSACDVLVYERPEQLMNRGTDHRIGPLAFDEGDEGVSDWITRVRAPLLTNDYGRI
ncbi:hypothetical protein LMG28614_06906 [Paraburkholderia ultramafica]|uniref:Uncharacterized protein n=2 Tax=Paraburkholderia ultramafica TaxID=1544867 RepID=A0A6S7BQ33_9BURK|nr:hypothetical protein LMG28614_06906 [Paraburkholderia ultramafica]